MHKTNLIIYLIQARFAFDQALAFLFIDPHAAESLRIRILFTKLITYYCILFCYDYPWE